MAKINAELEWLTKSLSDRNLVTILKNITFVVTDVDGCLTNCCTYMAEDGNRAKGFNIQDGLGMTLLQKVNIKLALLSGRKSTATERRAKLLGIPENNCITGYDDKLQHLEKLMKVNGASKIQTLYFGDDLPDVNIREHVGFFASPVNAPFYIQHAADLVVPRYGGDGAFRLLLDLLLYVQEKHPAQELISAALES